MGNTSFTQPPLILSDAAWRLLENAVAAVDRCECGNRCVHHRAGASCVDCARFSPPKGGYVVCDGYEPALEVVA